MSDFLIPASSVKIAVSQKFKKMLMAHPKLDDKEPPDDHARFHQWFGSFVLFALTSSTESQLSKLSKSGKVS